MAVFPVTTASGEANMALVKNTAGGIAGYCNAITTALASGPCPAALVLNLLNACVTSAATSTAIQNTTGAVTALLTFAQTTEQSLSGLTTNQIGTIMGTMGTAITSLQAAILLDYPVDGQGHLLDRTFVSGVPTMITLTAAQLTHTTAAITAFLATIQ